jgi:heme-degrading monooxygenase HmoA
MSFLLLRHRVQNYEAWKEAYDKHAPAREAAGLVELNLLRTIADPNEVLILFQTEDIERARAFAESDDLKAAMKNAGVISMPELIELK